MELPNKNDWVEYKMLVLDKLETAIKENGSLADKVDEKFSTLDKRLDSISYEIAVLKTKASLWGGMAGVIGSVAISIIAQMFMNNS